MRLRFAPAAALACAAGLAGAVPPSSGAVPPGAEAGRARAYVDSIRRAPLARADPELKRLLASGSKGAGGPEAEAAEIRRYLRLRAIAAAPQPAQTGEATKTAQAILRSPLFRTPPSSAEDNWLARALARLPKLKEPKSKRLDVVPPMPALGWVMPTAWIVLSLALATLLFLALRQVRLGRRTRAARSAVLEPDEPERTLDEWLARAGELERAGRFREAVRCLYVACLLRFDARGIARFERTETNWEHLRRIEASPGYDRAVDFRRTTGRFDRIWYGGVPAEASDVAEFRAAYLVAIGGPA